MTKDISINIRIDEKDQAMLDCMPSTPLGQNMHLAKRVFPAFT